jgi:uncharacterized protein involved in exopolysaccharide biosynthesis
MDSIVESQAGLERSRSDIELLASFTRRNWWVVVASLALALVAAVAYLLIARPSYTATAVLLIQPQSDQPNAQQVLATPELVRSQLAVLDSRSVLDAAVRRLQLYKDPEFDGGAPPSAPLDYRVARADEALAKRVTAENDGRSFAITLSVTSHSPDKSARIANAIAATYIDQQRIQKVKLIEATRQTLVSRLADLRAQTVAAEDAADAFRTQHGLVPLSSIPEDSESYAAATPSSRQIIELAKENATLAGDKASAAAAYTAQQRAIAAGRGDSTAQVLSSSVIADLRQQEAVLSKNQAELSARYQPDHPLVERNAAELQRVRGEIAAEIQRIHNSVASQARASSQAFGAADNYMNQLAARRSGEISASTRMTQLQEDAKLKRGVYEEYAAQMERSAERAGLELPDVMLASPASPPIQPSAPHKAFILLAAAMLGLIVGLALGVGRSLAGGTRVLSVRRSAAVAS